MPKLMKNSKQYGGVPDDLINKLGTDPRMRDLSKTINTLNDRKASNEWTYLGEYTQQLRFTNNLKFEELYIEVSYTGDDKFTYVYTFLIKNILNLLGDDTKWYYGYFSDNFNCCIELEFSSAKDLKRIEIIRLYYQNILINKRKD